MMAVPYTRYKRDDRKFSAIEINDELSNLMLDGVKAATAYDIVNILHDNPQKPRRRPRIFRLKLTENDYSLWKKRKFKCRKSVIEGLEIACPYLPLL